MKKWLLTLAVLVTLLLAGGASVSAAGYGPVVAESEIFSVTVSGVSSAGIRLYSGTARLP